MHQEFNWQSVVPFVRILGYLFIAGTPFLLLFGLYRYFHGKSTQKWPSTKGKITVSALKKHQELQTKYDRRAGFKPQWLYRHEFEYKYKVDGKIYTSSKMVYGQTPVDMNEAKAYALLEQYPLGKVITVYYNPKRPSEAVLVPNVPDTVNGLLGGVAVALIFGVVLIVASNLTS